MITIGRVITSMIEKQSMSRLHTLYYILCVIVGRVSDYYIFSYELSKCNAKEVCFEVWFKNFNLFNPA